MKMKIIVGAKRKVMERASLPPEMEMRIFVSQGSCVYALRSAYLIRSDRAAKSWLCAVEFNAKTSRIKEEEMGRMNEWMNEWMEWMSEGRGPKREPTESNSQELFDSTGYEFFRHPSFVAFTYSLCFPTMTAAHDDDHDHNQDFADHVISPLSPNLLVLIMIVLLILLLFLISSIMKIPEKDPKHTKRWKAMEGRRGWKNALL